MSENNHNPMTRAPIHFAEPCVERHNLPDGSFVLRSTAELGGYPGNICHHLHRWAEEAPTRVFLADRMGDNRAWRKVTYAEASTQVRALAQALLEMAAPEKPVAILSDNSIENGLLQLAAMYVGIPVVPISPAYSLISKDHAKLKHIFQLINPGVVFVQNAQQFAKALDSVGADPARTVTAAHAPPSVLQFNQLLQTTPSPQVASRFEQTGPDTVAKILFTSGSTGLPKGVLNTQRMLCSNQQMIAQFWRFLEEKPPVILDWLPWNHTFGGNHNFNMMLRNGGSIYVDDGKPAPGLIGNTLDNLREISPTISFNVPRGYEMLVTAFENSEASRDAFFQNLDMVFYAAAALPQNIWRRLEQLSLASRGQLVPMISSWGSTETAPLASLVHFQIDRAGVIGNPAPATQIKLVPTGSKLEMRVKGPSVTPGYYQDPEKTQAAFDEDGFYLTGDAGRLEDPDDPGKGLVFDGRIAEDFKLSTGTWVAVGNLRLKVIAAAGQVVQDAVIAGHDNDQIGVLIFPNEPGIRALCSDDGKTPLDQLITQATVINTVKSGLEAHNRENPGGSTRISLAMILSEPASIDANEITDKGYLNQRAVLERRKELVQRLFAKGKGCIVLTDN